MSTRYSGAAASPSSKFALPAVGSVDEKSVASRPGPAADPSMDETTDDIVPCHFDDEDDDPQPSSGWAALQNKNVSRVLLFCFLDGASHSIWRQDPFQVLIKDLSGDKAVGWMSGCSGITQMLAAVVAGYLGNTVKHEVVLRVGSMVGLFMILVAMFAAKMLSLPLFFVSQGLCGIYAGICATTTEAIFADSVATGRRAFVYNLKWMDQVLSSCVGLIISIAVLFHLGNQWEQSALVKTMFVGMLLHPVAMVVLWTMRDKYSLKDDDDDSSAETAVIFAELEGSGDGDDHVRKPASKVELMRRSLHYDDEAEMQAMAEVDSRAGTAKTAATPRTATEDTPWSSREAGADANNSSRRVHWSMAPPKVIASPATAVPGASPASSAASPSGCPPRSSHQKAVQTQLEEAYAAARQEFLANMLAAHGNYLAQLGHAVAFYARTLYRWEAVPYLVCLVDFLVAFGSGMTMRYMSLFFVEDYKTTPVTLLTASLLISPLTAILSFLVQRGGDLYVGRLPSTIIVRLIGTTLLLLMGTKTLSLNIMLPIYIFRNALMNSTRGVTRSVIMDCVKKENRAKWSAFESFSSFTWAGSAVFGGYIASAHGYKGTFVITAIFHYCSLAVLVPGAIGALPVERELMRTNRAKPHASCLAVTVVVFVIMAVASCFYAWFRSEVTKRNW